MVMQIKNTFEQGKRLVRSLELSGVEVVFDLDGVLLDARHRQKVWSQEDAQAGLCEPNQVGALDLNHYIANCKPELIHLDEALPLMSMVEYLNRRSITYHVATARVLCSDNMDLLARKAISAQQFLCRDGDHDRRRDCDLKRDKLIHAFGRDYLRGMALVDDCLANCEMADSLGMLAFHVEPLPTTQAMLQRRTVLGSVERKQSTLNIRPLIA